MASVQDCTDGYGAALGLAEIVELTPTTFRQIIRHTIRPGPLWPGRKLHTLNRCGRLEVIDENENSAEIRVSSFQRTDLQKPSRGNSRDCSNSFKTRMDGQRGRPFLVTGLVPSAPGCSLPWDSRSISEACLRKRLRVTPIVRFMSETRAAHRHRVLKAGAIEFSGGGAIGCAIKNLSATGAALEVVSALDIPDRLILCIPAEHFKRHCHVVLAERKADRRRFRIKGASRD